MRLPGRTAIVTGAGSGIGASIAELFAAQGASVAALDIAFDAAQAVSARIETNGGTAEAFAKYGIL